MVGCGGPVFGVSGIEGGIMKILVILGHPKTGSFNHAIAETAIHTLKDNGHEVIFHDLYREGLDPVLPHDEIPKGAGLDSVIRKHCEGVSDADGVIIIHPNWWGSRLLF